MSTAYTFRAIVAVKATKLTAANNWWKANIDTVGGENTFVSGLSATGQAPATWYWCATSMRANQLQAVADIVEANPNDSRLVIWPTPYGNVNDLLDKFVDNGTTIRVLNSKSITPQQVLTAAGLQVIQPSE